MANVYREKPEQPRPQATTLFDKFHVIKHQNEAVDKVRKNEYARLSGKDRQFLKGAEIYPA